MKPHLTALLPYFVSIAEGGSLTEAARAHAITQPALSRKIKLLEEGLNVQLFQRHARGMKLTTAGRILLRRAKLIALEGRYAIDEIELLKGNPGASLKISAGPVWSTSMLPQAIAQVIRTFPNFDASIEVSGDPKRIEAVASGDVDLYAGGLDVELCEKHDLSFEKALTIEYRVFAGHDHPLLTQTALGLGALAAHPWTRHVRDGAWPFVTDMIRRSTGESPACVVTSASLLSAMQAAAHGPFLIGLAHPLDDIARCFGLAPLRSQPLDFRFSSGFCYRPSATGLAQFASLVDGLRAACRAI